MINKLSISIVMFFCFVQSIVSFAQNSCKLTIEYTNDNESYVYYGKDSLALNNELKKQLFLTETKGYVGAKVILNEWAENALHVIITKGEKYNWGNVEFNETLKDFYKEINFTEEFNPTNVYSEFKKVLGYCENNGYPFSSIEFTNVVLKNNVISATASLSLQDYFVIDSIDIKGECTTNRFVVYREIGVYPGDIYNEKAIRNIEKRINSSSFLTFVRGVEVSYTKGKALLTVFVNNKANNKFGGILGINSDDITGNVVFSGDVDLNLINAINNGEKFALNWRKTRENTQNFFLGSSFPYLFKSKIGFNVELSSLRRDTSFSNLGAKFGLSYSIQNNQFVSLFIKNNISNSLFDINANQVPIYNTSRVLYYGMEFTINSYDYVYNPRRGFGFDGTISSGIKTIVKNSTVLNNEYASISEKSNQYELLISINKFFPLFKTSALFFQLKSGQLFNDNLFENELYQLGGLKSLRGFNEQGLLASNYVIGTFEYRFLFDKNSAFFTYLDYAYTEKRTANYLYDTPYGFGLGVNLAVNSGVFSLSYGLGTQQQNPILFKNSKVHFGFISVF